MLVLIIVTGVLGFLSYWGDLNPWLDLLCQFKILFAYILTLGLLVFLLMKCWRLAALSFILFLINSISLLFYLLPVEHPGMKQPGITLRILEWNTWASNPSANNIEQVIRTTQPDLVILVELHPHNAQLLFRSPLMLEYPERAWIENHNTESRCFTSAFGHNLVRYSKPV